MSYKVFIDGSEGTTGLQLQERLAKHPEIELLHIEEELHRDPARRKEFINMADVVFLCLPDAAAIEAVSLCEDPDTIIIDASTAHRINDDWVYGLPELSSAHRAAINKGKRIANPGCYATGAICILHPLIKLGIIPASAQVSINAVSGYSGGGKKMIAAYQGEQRTSEYDYPRNYALSLQHKHLPEIRKISGLDHTPIFMPQVCDFYAGMAVSIPLSGNATHISAALQEYYAKERFVCVKPLPASGFINAGENTGTNLLTIYVSGNDEQVVLTSVLDNLGKGASGAAVQNMNIALSLPEEISLL